MNYVDLKDYLSSNELDSLLLEINCNDITLEKQRYFNLLEEAYKLYGDGDYHFISSPGRSEIGGNHTDHQHGHVLACALNIDNVVIVKANNTNICNYCDKLFKPVKVDLNNLLVNKEEFDTSESLIRGVASKFNELGYKIGGFDALCDSHVLIGSGISSSACFEVMIVEVFNCLFNNKKVNPIDRAIIGQYAENVYFGKPSGLMDQMAISVGSFIAIDFKDPNKPIIDKYDFSFTDKGYELVLVNTKGDHADLSHEYAAIPNEIKEVGKVLNVDYLADSSFDEFLSKLPEIRSKVRNDRAILRSYHFFNEDSRVLKEAASLKNNDIKKLLELIKESGKSSYEYLQNVYPASRPISQSLAIGLAMADYFLKDDGAYRVHGGGFDGTIQVILPKNRLNEFKEFMTPIFGEDSLLVLKVRPVGTKLMI